MYSVCALLCYLHSAVFSPTCDAETAFTPLHLSFVMSCGAKRSSLARGVIDRITIRDGRCFRPRTYVFVACVQPSSRESNEPNSRKRRFSVWPSNRASFFVRRSAYDRSSARARVRWLGTKPWSSGVSRAARRRPTSTRRPRKTNKRLFDTNCKTSPKAKRIESQRSSTTERISQASLRRRNEATIARVRSQVSEVSLSFSSLTATTIRLFCMICVLSSPREVGGDGSVHHANSMH